MMETGEIIDKKVYASPRLPPKISFQDNWMKELDSEVAGGSEDSQQIQPKSKTQLSRTVRPVGEQEFTQELEKDVLSGREGTPNTQQERRDPWMDQNPSRVACQCLYKLKTKTQIKQERGDPWVDNSPPSSRK